MALTPEIDTTGRHGIPIDSLGSYQAACARARRRGNSLSTQLDEAVVHLREMILRGKLAPGERVAEAPLAEELGMSRTPVRQALPLAQEGLLAVHESRGYVVRAFTAGDVLDAIDIRGVLEGLAARRVAEHGATKPFLRKLHACLHDGDTLLAKRRMEESDEATYSEMNGRFHSLILEEAGSQILSEALARELPRPVRRPCRRLPSTGSTPNATTPFCSTRIGSIT